MYKSVSWQCLPVRLISSWRNTLCDNLRFALPGCLPSNQDSDKSFPAGIHTRAQCIYLMSTSTHAHRPQTCWFLHLRENANTCNCTIVYWCISVVW